MNGGVEGGDIFFQNLGVDEAPVPFPNDKYRVYSKASSYLCNGEPQGSVTYVNTFTEPNIPEHQFEEGFCANCGNLDYDYVTPAEDGYYEISDASVLLWWAHLAAEKLNVSCRLTADIDMDGYSENYPAIGTEAKPFYGNFDGQHHTISNLNISFPNTRAVGLISCMNSEPSTPADATAARAAEGVFIRNVTLDSSCSITGGSYVGLVGQTAGWAGHVTFYNIGMQGDVTALVGANAAGVLGCVMSSTCHVTIDNCYMTGDVYGVNENASFCAWLGSYAEVKNCYAIGSVQAPQSDERYFARYSSATITNCYAKYGTQVPTVTDEEVMNGALAYKANGSKVTNPLWYQNLQGDEIDEFPVPNPAHGVVFAMGEDVADPDAPLYYSVSNEDELQELKYFLEDREANYLEEMIAHQELIDTYTAAVAAMLEKETIEEVAADLQALHESRTALNASVNTYKSYVSSTAAVLEKLLAHAEIESADKDLLEEYMESDSEPTENWPLGGYHYVLEQHVASDADIKAEIARIEELYMSIIRNAYAVGSDVTELFVNADFSGGNTGWTVNGGKKLTGTKTVTVDGKKYTGAEAWATQLDIQQSVSGLKPGYYLVTLQGGTRPSENRYGYNHTAQLQANGVANYLMTVREGAISPADAKNHVNCHIENGGTLDMPLWDDEYSTYAYSDTLTAWEQGLTLLGFAVQGPESMAYAVAGDRMKNYTIGYVGEDSTLTVRIYNPTAKYLRAATGIGNLRVQYCGDATTDATAAAFDLVLEGQAARANTILNEYEAQYAAMDIVYARTPNYPMALRTVLSETLAAKDAAADVAAKEAVVKTFSEAFNNIYAGKQAYISMYNNSMVVKELANMDYERLGEEQANELFAAADLVDGHAFDGDYSLEEALNPAEFENPLIKKYIPEMDEDDVMLLAKPDQLIYFSAYVSNINAAVNAKVTAPLDMTGIQFYPIGSTGIAYTGTFDGQAQPITNLYVEANRHNSGLFYKVSGTVKNVDLSGYIHSSVYKMMGGICGDLDGTIDNCHIRMTMASDVTGDGTHGGVTGRVVATTAKISNCLVENTMTGEATDRCGGISGWTDYDFSISNVLIISDYGVMDNGSHTICRSSGTPVITLSNVYYLNQLGTAGGTKTTKEVLSEGAICYAMNGSQSDEPVWFQTLGVDSIPQLFNGDVVYFYNNAYSNVAPVVELNAFAYDVQTTSNADAVTVSYSLTGPAEKGEIRFFNEAKELVYTEPLTTDALTTGAHEVAVANSVLPAVGTKLTLEVEVTGIGSVIPKKVGESYKTWGSRGIAVNNAPASPGFGQVYALESIAKGAPQNDTWGTGTNYTGYISDDKLSGLYAFNAGFEQINAADGTPGFTGGLTYGGGVYVNNDNYYDLKSIRVSKDGRIFIGRACANSNSPVVEVNAADLNEPWTPLFTGGELVDSTGVTYVGEEAQSNLTVSIAVEGEGENLKLWLLGGARSDGNENETDFTCYTYNLGTAKTWDKPASSVFEPLTAKYTASGSPVTIETDGKGGIWYVQWRGTTTEINPSVKHYNIAEVEDYSDISTVYTGGALAINNDSTLIAISQYGNMIVYSCDYVPMANGMLYLNPLMSIPTSEGYIHAAAFDYADNLYLVSQTSHAVSRYTVPVENKTRITPGNAASAFTVGEEKLTAIEGVEATTETGDIYTIGGVRVNKAQKGINIINGKKVMVK